MTAGVPIDLPQTNAKPLNSQVEPLTVSIMPDGSVYLIKEPVTIEQLSQKLASLYVTQPDKEIRVRGDAAAAYEPIAKVLGAINGAGFKKIGLETLPGGASPAAPEPAAQPDKPAEGQN
jgi:biopolymer transport protein TolR